MVTKTQAKNANVDWKAVEKATEVRRTYLVTLPDGRQVYKMYKPSEAQKIFRSKGWKGKLVGILDKSRKKHDDSPRKNIRKGDFESFMDHCGF